MCERIAQTKEKDLYWAPLWRKNHALIHAREEDELVESIAAIRRRSTSYIKTLYIATMNA